MKFDFKKVLIRIRNVFKEAFFPTKCLVCGSFFSTGVSGKDASAAEDIRGRCQVVQSGKSGFDLLMAPFLCSTCLDGFLPAESPVCSRCGLLFKSREGEDHVCGDCLASPKYFTISRSVGVYDRTLMDVLHRFKYSGKIQLAKPLSALLFSGFRCHWNPDDIDLIVPVPLHKNKLRTRGFNQAFLLVREWDQVAASVHLKRTGKRIGREILVRNKWTEPQTGLGRKQRKANIKNAFKLNGSANVTGRRILLVDDVYTTGATVNECARMLLKGGAGRVDVLTLARAM